METNWNIADPGLIMSSTAINPTPTANHCLRTTFSPSIGTASAITIKGATAAIACASANWRNRKDKVKSPISPSMVKPRTTWSPGFFVFNESIPPTEIAKIRPKAVNRAYRTHKICATDRLVVRCFDTASIQANKTIPRIYQGMPLSFRERSEVVLTNVPRHLVHDTRNIFINVLRNKTTLPKLYD